MALPRDVLIDIMKLVYSDMDTRVRMGFIGKLRIPEALRSRLSRLPLPSQLAHNIHGVRLGGRVIVFRRVVGSKFFANASKCDEYVQESRAFFATPKLSYRSEQMQRYQELNTWFVDLWMGPL
jgi:hypothetical protein